MIFGVLRPLAKIMLTIYNSGEQPAHHCIDIINVPGPQERPRTPVMPESPMTRVSSTLSSRPYPLDPTFTYLDSEVIQFEE